MMNEKVNGMIKIAFKSLVQHAIGYIIFVGLCGCATPRGMYMHSPETLWKKDVEQANITLPSNHKDTGSSAESVDGFRCRQLAKCMV